MYMSLLFFVSTTAVVGPLTSMAKLLLTSVEKDLHKKTLGKILKQLPTTHVVAGYVKIFEGLPLSFYAKIVPELF